MGLSHVQLMVHAWPINEPHLPKVGPRCYTKSSTALGAFRPVLISYTGVIGRWGDWEMGWLGDGDCYLEHRMQLNGWHCSKVGRDSWKHCLFVQLFFVKLSFIWKLYKQSYPHVQLVVHVWTINKSHHHKNCQPKRYPKSPTVHDVLQPIPIIFYGTSSHQLHSGEEGLYS